MHLNTSCKNFFKRLEVGFPNFKSKKTIYFSYTTHNQKRTVKIGKGKLKIPKLKSWIRIKQHRLFDGLINSCTLSTTTSNKYYISILIENDKDSYLEPISNHKIGIDTGLKEFCVCSNGFRVSNPQYLRKSELKIAKAQRRLYRKKKGSNNRNKSKIKVARIHDKIKNQSYNFLHKLSTKLIRENPSIAIENLQIVNMIKKHKLAKAISEASWGILRTFLEYKAKWYKRNIIIAPSHFASSQLCSHCEYQHKYVKDLKVKVKVLITH